MLIHSVDSYTSEPSVRVNLDLTSESVDLTTDIDHEGDMIK